MNFVLMSLLALTFFVLSASVYAQNADDSYGKYGHEKLRLCGYDVGRPIYCDYGYGSSYPKFGIEEQHRGDHKGKNYGRNEQRGGGGSHRRDER